ncbi:MAG TPA: hypothetical protein PKA88_23975, partial [Polyangiaceae bacterium]|nr:hypothetical protein [Polyangiaceae bacterium]
EVCLGVVPESPHTSCDPAAQANAEQMLDELAVAGCGGPPAGKADSAFCKFMKWDPLGWCESPAEVLGPEPEGSPTQYPIILAHGFNTSTTNFWRFNDVDLALAADGHGAQGPSTLGNVILGSVPPFDTPEVRAGFLEKQMDELLAQTGASKVNLICFSAGGPDCRYLASPGGLNRGDQIASITTISSPHRGSYVADVASKALPGSDKSKAVDFLATLYGKTFSEVADDSHIVAAFEAMSEKNSATFNQTITDHPSVQYASWAGVSFVGGLPHPKPSKVTDACRNEAGEVKTLWHEERRDRMDPLLVGGAVFVAHGTELRPNDGVSTVESAKWGDFRGCIPADHLDQVGQINDERPNKHTGFDYIRFYRNLAFDLAARGL